MQLNTSPPLHVLSFSVRTTLADLGKYGVTVPKQLYAEAALLGLLVTGPLRWRYLGADGRRDTVFTLQIGLPVERPAHPTEGILFSFEEWPAFYGLAQIHEGPWELLHETYGKGIEWLLHEGYTIGPEARESYLNVDLVVPAFHRTEVHIGIV
ncbi:GyrI-like domain-containing protein [Dinghuibacter silviterrae]|uniref:GyrI-like small molecule binding protein n=1 Tax=Dinghuibacter silviterrae TaxID=1539049 RepID=A0A4R8DP78_9BACT|nr:GyrI-like domain-containing protein [Dinghuibacter silviterrae]TDW99525.1 hypothetical protein EDB95_0535 [Dinghuibacter silviterrae]